MISKLKKGHRMPQHKVRALLEILEQGTRPPKEFLEERGYSAEDFRDPDSWIRKVAKGEPKGYIALLKQRKKMFTLGALAGPLPEGLESDVFGKKPIPMPEFVIEEGPEKHRVIMDFSAKPSDPRNSGPGSDDFTANTGYDKAETSCTFPDIRDKAAFVAAFGGGKASLVDIKGMFWQIPQHKDVLHYQVVPLILPGDSEVSYYVLMTNAMGTSGAPAGCVSLHILLLELAELYSPGKLTTKDYKGPESYGLVKESDKKWEDFLVKPHESKQNDQKWVGLRGETFGRFKTGSTMLCDLLHMDDNNIGGSDVEPNQISTNYLLDFYKRINLKVSKKHPTTPTDDPILTGHLASLPKQLIGFTTEKWQKVETCLAPVLEGKPVRVGDLLKLAGLLTNLAEVFPEVKIHFIPLSRWLGGMNEICKTDKAKWRVYMDKTMVVPPPLVDLIRSGWEKARGQKWASVKDLLYTEADASMVVSTDASGDSVEFPSGIGAVVHSVVGGQGSLVPGTKTMILIPKDHPMNDRPIAWTELFMSVLWVIRLGRVGEVLVLYTDNSASEHWMDKFKAKPLYVALIIILSSVCLERRIKLIIKRSDTDNIPADPLSRWIDGTKSAEEWVRRAGKWGIPSEGPRITCDWQGLWNSVVEIEGR